MSTNATEAVAGAEASAKPYLGAEPGIAFGIYILGQWLDAPMEGILIVQLSRSFTLSQNGGLLVKLIVVYLSHSAGDLSLSCYGTG
jgi:hypothetical protein